MSVQIIIDSACDMPKAEADERDLLFLPLRTQFGKTDYLDGVTITHEEFYQRLETCDELPTTSQLTPLTFYRHIRPRWLRMTRRL